LSEERAKAVMAYLIGKSVSEERLIFKGYGFSKPVASNDSEEGRAINRRVEFIILNKGEEP
jgi:outer membrane protein OmpA-like peptidoglycan-associated protein